MSFGIYLGGYLVFCIGLLIGLHLLHMPDRWIAVIALIFIGLGITSAVAKTRTKDT
jgi:cadmium resistance protein CadD (predicted permease)